jgi:hypothetical protein
MQIVAAIVAAGLAISAVITPAVDGKVVHPDATTSTTRGSTADSDLNADVSKRNADAAADYARKQADFQKAQTDYQQAQKDYQTRLAQTRDAAQKYERDKAAWAAKVAACKAGDTSQCAP